MEPLCLHVLVDQVSVLTRGRALHWGKCPLEEIAEDGENFRSIANSYVFTAHETHHMELAAMKPECQPGLQWGVGFFPPAC